MCKFPAAFATISDPSLSLESPPITLMFPEADCSEFCATTFKLPTEPALPVFNVIEPGVVVSEEPVSTSIDPELKVEPPLPLSNIMEPPVVAKLWPADTIIEPVVCIEEATIMFVSPAFPPAFPT